MKTQFLFRILIMASVLTLMASSTIYLLIGSALLLFIAKVSFVAFGIAVLLNISLLLFSEYRQSVR